MSAQSDEIKLEMNEYEIKIENNDCDDSGADFDLGLLKWEEIVEPVIDESAEDNT